MEINLDHYINNDNLILYGRKNGYELRLKLDLDRLEKEYSNIVIIIPEYICSLNSSYFIGLFKESVKKINIVNFKNKYRFKCSKYIEQNIRDGLISIYQEIESNK